MITAFINDLVNFFNSLFSFVLLYWVFKLMLWYFFRIRIKLPKFRKANLGKVRVNLKHSSKSDYEFRKFKYETKLKYRNQYKIEKLRLKMGVKETHKGTNSVASLPNYIKVIK